MNTTISTLTYFFSIPLVATSIATNYFGFDINNSFQHGIAEIYNVFLYLCNIRISVIDFNQIDKEKKILILSNYHSYQSYMLILYMLNLHNSINGCFFDTLDVSNLLTFYNILTKTNCNQIVIFPEFDEEYMDNCRNSKITYIGENYVKKIFTKNIARKYDDIDEIYTFHQYVLDKKHVVVKMTRLSYSENNVANAILQQKQNICQLSDSEIKRMRTIHKKPSLFYIFFSILSFLCFIQFFIQLFYFVTIVSVPILIIVFANKFL